jgi:hypothetical protein
MAKKKWVPRSDRAFDGFFDRYSAAAVENTSGESPVWPHAPRDRALALRSCYTAWHAAYMKVKEEAHTSGDVLAKQELRAESEAELRAFNREFILFSRHVTDAQRRDIGCPVHDKHPTPMPTPWAQCEADIAYPGRHLLELAHIRAVQGTMSEEEAELGFGVRIFWGILGSGLSAVPVTGDDLPHSTFTRRKRFRFDFDGESGKTVYFCLRYENGKGGKEGEGPFGPIFSAIIP